jgi:hypothetical protein
LIRTGRADVERKAAAWKQALLAKGWTEYPPQ